MKMMTIFATLAFLFTANSARADVLLTMHANKSFDASYSIVSNGNITLPQDFKDSKSPRCAIWGGQDGNFVNGVKIQSGQDIVISADPQYPLSVSDTMVLRLLDSSGKQFAGLTCGYMDSSTFGVDANSIRSFLNTQFGSNADIK